MDKVVSLIKDLIAKAFYGEVLIKFEHGKIVLIGLFIWRTHANRL